MPKGDPLTYAVDAERNLEGLATELARMGADEQTVNAVSQMADVTRKIVKALGKGQAETGDQQPPYPEQQPAQAQPRTIGEATSALHSDMQQSAQQRA